MEDFYKNYIQELNSCLSAIDPKQIESIKDLLLVARNNNKRIYVVGNGGSASTSSHMVNDISKGVLGHTGERKVKRFKITSVADNVACLTAWANDTKFDDALSEQLKNLIEKDDVLLAISASGNSNNIINAVSVAKERGAKVIGLAGFDGGKLEKLSDICLTARIDKYDVAEDAHLIVSHILTRWFFENLKD